jgi:Transposase
MARGKKYQPEQVINLLRQVEVAVANGKSTDQACRDAGIVEQTYYRWRKEYGGLQVDQARNERFRAAGTTVGVGSAHHRPPWVRVRRVLAAVTLSMALPFLLHPTKREELIRQMRTNQVPLHPNLFTRA